MAAPAPSFQRRRLREVLRRLREEADLTQEQAATAMEWSNSKIIRIEAGSVGVTVNDLRSLLDLYRVTERGQIDELLALARASRRRSWLSPYRDMYSPGFITYAELEADTSEIRNFQAILVPGLLQTPEYTEACIEEGTQTTGRHDNVRTRVDIRMRRQSAVFDQAEPPEQYVVLDEAVLHRRVGGIDVMRAQLRHLAKMGERRYMHISVIPFTHGVHVGAFGPFVILDFPDPRARPVLYREGPFVDELVRDKSELIASYRAIFDRLAKGALDEAESLEFIGRIAGEMK